MTGYVVWTPTKGLLAGTCGTIQADGNYPALNPANEWDAMGRYSFEGYAGTPLQPGANVSFDIQPGTFYVDASTIVPDGTFRS